MHKRLWWGLLHCSQFELGILNITLSFSCLVISAREENVATFRGSEYFCYDLSQNPIQSSSDEITLSFKTWQRNGLLLHTGKSADYVNLALKDGAVSLVINLGSGAFEAIVEPVNGKFNDNSWHDIKVTRNLRQVIGGNSDGWSLRFCFVLFCRKSSLKSFGEGFNKVIFILLVVIPSLQFWNIIEKTDFIIHLVVLYSLKLIWIYIHSLFYYTMIY